MGLIEKIRGLSRKNRIIIISALAAVVVAAVVIIFLSRNNYLAKTMRLLRVEGTVNIESSTGGTKPAADNIRFQSGDALNTGSDGLASVGLDDTKIITLQNDSRAEFKKNGKQLELNLTKGAVFFNVTEKLKPEETFEIKTSTMTAGIRGTSGMIYYDEAEGRDSIIVTDGSVEVTAVNPTTGEVKTAKVEGGQRIKVYLYTETTESHDTVEFFLDEITEEELPDFSVQMIAENEELLNRVCEYTGWDKETLKELVQDIASGEAEGEEIELTPTPELTEVPEETPAPDNIADITPSPTPTGTPSPTPEPTATTKPGATVTPSPAATATPKLTNTPTLTPVPTATSTSTLTPTPSNTSTPTNTPTNTSTPTNTPTLIPGGPALPAGYYQTSLWGVTYGGSTVYIAKLNDSGKAKSFGQSPRQYRGYENGHWYDLILHDLGDSSYYELETFNGVYYSDQYLSGPGYPSYSMELPSGYEEYIWGQRYNGKDIYICRTPMNSSYDYLGYDDIWFDIYNEQNGNNEYFYYTGSDQIYYYGPIPVVTN